MTIKQTYSQRCPKCRSVDFETEYESYEETLHELCTCQKCDYAWTNEYEFKSRFDTVSGEDDDGEYED